MMTDVRTFLLLSLFAVVNPALAQTPAIDLAAVVSGVSTDGVTEVPLKKLGAWATASVSLNGRGPFAVLIDTGSTTTALDRSVVETLGLAVRGRREVVSLTGATTVPLVAVDRLAIEGASVTGLHALVQDLEALRALDASLVGILGQDVLAGFDVLIDYQRRTLTLDSQAGRLRQRLRGDVLPLGRADGRPMVAAAAGRTAPMGLVLDSASDTVIVFADAIERRAGAVAEDQRQLQVLATTGGTRLVRSGRVDRLAFGRTKVDDVVAVIHDAAKRNGRIEDGVVPTCLFERVFVSMRDGVALLNPRRVPAPEVRLAQAR